MEDVRNFSSYYVYVHPSSTVKTEPLVRNNETIICIPSDVNKACFIKSGAYTFTIGELDGVTVSEKAYPYLGNANRNRRLTVAISTTSEVNLEICCVDDRQTPIMTQELKTHLVYSASMGFHDRTLNKLDGFRQKIDGLVAKMEAASREISNLQREIRGLREDFQNRVQDSVEVNVSDENRDGDGVDSEEA